jgi:hypothetical protein
MREAAAAISTNNAIIAALSGDKNGSLKEYLNGLSKT